MLTLGCLSLLPCCMPLSFHVSLASSPLGRRLFGISIWITFTIVAILAVHDGMVPDVSFGIPLARCLCIGLNLIAGACLCVRAEEVGARNRFLLQLVATARPASSGSS